MTTIEGYEGGFIPQGWQCPVCHRVYAPTWPWCTTCGQGVTITSSTELLTNMSTEDAQKKDEIIRKIMVGDTPETMKQIGTDGKTR